MILWSLFLFSLPAVAHARRTPGDTRPNIVLYFPDTISAESLGVYGHPVVKTPHFNRFSNMSTTFDVALSSYPQCSPSRCALATARHPHVLGHRTMTRLLQPQETNMFALLKESGYTTLLLGKNDMLAQETFNTSFTYWENCVGQDEGTNSYVFGQAGYYSFLSNAGTSQGNDANRNRDLKAVNQALAFMSNDPPEPFCIFLPGIGAHPPYGAPADWYGMYSPEEIKSKAPLRPYNYTNKPAYFGPQGIRYYRNVTTLDPEAFAYRVNADYLARVSYTDWIFGQLLDGLDAMADMAARTVLAVSSDHGDFQGNWGLVEKWSGAGEDLLLRVPLMVRHPAGPKGLRVPYPVQLFDLFPTFMDIANLTSVVNDPDKMYVHFGKSLLPQILNHPNPDRHSFVFAEAGYYYFNELEYNDPTQRSTWTQPKEIYYPRGQEEHLGKDDQHRFVVMRNATYKLIYRASGLGVRELYDLSQDPRELTNVYGQERYAAVAQEMQSILLDWYLLTADVVESVFDPRGLPPSPPWPAN